MKALMCCLVLFTGQLIGSQEVVRLPPGTLTIPPSYGGKLVELLNAPADLGLPSLRFSSAKSSSWRVDIKNLGPHDVTIRSGNQLAVLLHPNESTTIVSRGSSYYVRTRSMGFAAPPG
jgi:hypothetical protein